MCGARLKHGTKILKVSAGRFSLVSPQPLFVYIPFSMRLCSRINTRMTLTERTATASSLIVRSQEIFQSFEFFHTGHRFTNQERHCIRNVLPWTELEPRPLSHAMWHSVSKHQKGWYIVDISTHRYGLFYCRSNIVSAFDRLCNFVTVHDLIWIRKSENTATLKVSQVSTMYCLHLLLTTVLKHEIL